MGNEPDNCWGVVRFGESTHLLNLQSRDGRVSLAAAMSLEVNKRRLTMADAVAAGGPRTLQPGEEARVTLVFDNPAVVATLLLSFSNDAETVLLVDDDQCEVFEDNFLLDERVRADENRDLPVRHPF